MKNIRIALLPSLLVLVLLVSGCTIPGLEWLFPGPSSEANDVVVIKSLQVTPAAQIEEGQSIHLYADVENIEEPGYPAAKNVQLVIYDYCQNLFDTPKANCPSGAAETDPQNGIGCSLNDLKPKEIRTVDWTIKAKKIPVTQTCDIKLKVTYDFSTKGATRIVFIDPEELSARIRRGESWKVSASETLDYGPVKPYVTVMDQQPVPYSSAQPAGATIKVQIKNVGDGYVSSIPYVGNNNGNILEDTQSGLQIELAQESDPISGAPQQTGCVFDKDGQDAIELIQKQSSPLICKVTPPGGTDIVTEKTFHIQSKVSYTYEFRKEVKITVKPAKSAG